MNRAKRSTVGGWLNDVERHVAPLQQRVLRDELDLDLDGRLGERLLDVVDALGVLALRAVDVALQRLVHHVRASTLP